MWSKDMKKGDSFTVISSSRGQEYMLEVSRLIKAWKKSAREQIADPSTEKDEKKRAKLQRQLDDFKEKQDWLTKIREGLLAVLGNEAKDTDFPNPYWFAPTSKEKYLYLVDNDFEGLREWKRQCFDERDDKSKKRSRDIGGADKIIVTNTNIGGIQVHKFELGLGKLIGTWKGVSNKNVSDPSTEKDEKERAKLQRQLDDRNEKQDWLTKIREGLLAVLGKEAEDRLPES
jgi:predicted DNA binding CopG/RHH family protein